MTNEVRATRHINWIGGERALPNEAIGARSRFIHKLSGLCRDGEHGARRHPLVMDIGNPVTREDLVVILP